MANLWAGQRIVTYCSNIWLSVWCLLGKAISCRTSLNASKKKWLRGNSSNTIVSLHVCACASARAHIYTLTQFKAKVNCLLQCNVTKTYFVIFIIHFNLEKELLTKVGERMWTNSKVLTLLFCSFPVLTHGRIYSFNETLHWASLCWNFISKEQLVVLCSFAVCDIQVETGWKKYINLILIQVAPSSHISRPRWQCEAKNTKYLSG